MTEDSITTRDIIEWARTINFAAQIPDAFEKFTTSIAHEGFDAETIMVAFNTNAMDKNKTKSERDSDVVKCVIIGLERGALRQDTILKTGDEGQKVINELLLDYKIKVKKNKNDKMSPTRRTITFPRMVQCFPLWSCRLLTEGFCKGPKLTTVKWNVEALPPAMKNPGFSSMMRSIKAEMTDNQFRAIRLAALAWALCFNQTVSTADATKDLAKVVLPRVVMYFDLGSNYDLIDPKVQVLTHALYAIGNKKYLNQEIIKVAEEFNNEFELDKIVDLTTLESVDYTDYLTQARVGKSCNDAYATHNPLRK